MRDPLKNPHAHPKWARVLPVPLEPIDTLKEAMAHGPFGGFQCVKTGGARWRPETSPGEDRTWESLDWVHELQAKLDPTTRWSPYYMDIRDMGVTRLPTVQDLVGDILPDEDEVEQRTDQLVDQLRAAGATRYQLDNVFPLTSELTNAATRLTRRPLDIPWSDARPANLLHFPLDVSKAFVSPMRLLTGLITRLEKNWPPMLDAYRRLSAGIGTLEDFHLHVEFCWLGWGPSVLTTSLEDGDDPDRLMVLQAAYGDEANSLPVIMKRAAWTACFRDLVGDAAGLPVSLGNLLVVWPTRDPFFFALKREPLVADMFDDSQRDPAIALYFPWHEAASQAPATPIDDGWVRPYSEAGERHAPAFYSTAYAWLILEQTVEGDVTTPLSPTLEPGQVIPFFEHPNLANPSGLAFFLRCLVRKALDHVVACGRVEAYAKGYYRLATALFPEATLDLFHEELDRLQREDPKAFEIAGHRLGLPVDWRDMRPHEEVVAFSGRLYHYVLGAFTKGS
jgi:hypothetical protein